MDARRAEPVRNPTQEGRRGASPREPPADRQIFLLDSGWGTATHDACLIGRSGALRHSGGTILEAGAQPDAGASAGSETAAHRQIFVAAFGFGHSHPRGLTDWLKWALRLASVAGLRSGRQGR
jgi:hypothetical protein